MGLTASKMNEVAIARRIARNLLNLNEIRYVSAANPESHPKTRGGFLSIVRGWTGLYSVCDFGCERNGGLCPRLQAGE